MSSIAALSAQYAGEIGSSSAGLLKGSTDQGEGGFAGILNDALNLTESTEAHNDSSSLSLLSGQTDDIAQVLIDAQKAETALSLTIQLRNKLMDSYDAIMNMQI